MEGEEEEDDEISFREPTYTKERKKERQKLGKEERRASSKGNKYFILVFLYLLLELWE